MIMPHVHLGDTQEALKVSQEWQSTGDPVAKRWAEILEQHINDLRRIIELLDVSTAPPK
jgi:hypothetical protein